MEYPQITIVTKYEGVGPEETEKLISKIVEETAGTIKRYQKSFLKPKRRRFYSYV
ncbi:MAG: hypothetical protein LBS81_01815 [Endomicrobium sp.]|nr:hypothetical protein [Endomicrobium sp.]